MTHRRILRPGTGWRAQAALAVLWAAALPACGAKTGLLVAAFDAAPDVDAAVIDVPTDADVEDLPVVAPDVPTRLELTVQARIRAADFFLLVDNSASMDPIIRALTENFSRTIVPGVRAQVSDVRFGVGSFSSMPDGVGGSPGTPGDYTLWVRQRMTTDVGLVQRAFDNMRTINRDIPGFGGGDEPECQTEALYELIEGGGSRGHEADARARLSVLNALDPLGNGWVPRVDPARDCAPGAAARGAFGWGCFEAGRVPIVLLASDAEWYDGYLPSSPRSPFGHTAAELSGAMMRRGAHFIGLDVGTRGTLRTAENTRQLTRVTGTVDRAGAPLVLVLRGGFESVATEIIDAVAAIAQSNAQDVTARIEPDAAERRLPAGRTTADFVRAVTALRGVPEAPAGYARREAATFYGVNPATRLVFGLELQNTFYDPAAAGEVFLVTLVVTGRSGSELDRREVRFVVPPRR